MNAMNYAAQEGHLEILKWLHEKSITESDIYAGCTTRAMDNAAKYSYIEVIQWLHHNRTEGCSNYAMNWAADSGHIDVPKWLHENRTEGCDQLAMTWAAQNGHLEIVKWLYKKSITDGNRYQVRIKDAIKYVCDVGHTDLIDVKSKIVKWLRDREN